MSQLLLNVYKKAQKVTTVCLIYILTPSQMFGIGTVLDVVTEKSSGTRTSALAFVWMSAKRSEKCKWYCGFTCVFLPHFLQKATESWKMSFWCTVWNLSVEPDRCEAVCLTVCLTLPSVPDVLLRTATSSDEVCNGSEQASFTSNCGFRSGSQTVQNPPDESSRDSHSETHTHAHTHISPCLDLRSCYLLCEWRSCFRRWLAHYSVITCNCSRWLIFITGPIWIPIELLNMSVRRSGKERNMFQT